MLLLFYLTAMTIYAFVLFGVDKRRATKDTKHLIPERKLITLTVLGGAVGSIFTNYRLAFRFFEGAVKIAPSDK